MYDRRSAVAVVLAAILALALGTGMAGCTAPPAPSGGGTPAPGGGGTPPATAGGTTVTEQNFQFTPATLAVKVGDTVTFTNADSAPHNVSIDNQELGQQAQGQSVTWTPKKAGSFPYKCTIHPNMTGTITVQ